MVTFFAAVVALIVGYFVYGFVVEKIFKPTDRKTPAVENSDGVDYIPLPTWKVFLIQLLNIAGLGPIFGALAGALWGSSVYLWIVFGTIFAGGVHDYLSGMISIREGGQSIAEVVGTSMGSIMREIMRVVSVILLVLVGTVFLTGPAMLLTKLTEIEVETWVLVILVYYFLATLLPIDKMISKIYPLFGAVLLIMAIGICGSMLMNFSTDMPELTLENIHPNTLEIFPMMFVTVACGAISGFHSTQSPIAARCLKDERDGRFIFYGAMVAEGIIALIWAAAGNTFFANTFDLQQEIRFSGQGGAVYEVCIGFLGVGIGSTLAMLGVIACPITSGDTAFRSVRLAIADWFGIEQSKFSERLSITIPLLFIAAMLSQIDFDIIWRYFSWTNQTLAMIVLWTGAVYIYRNLDNKIGSMIAVIPATFMSMVTMTYIFHAPEGLHLDTFDSYLAGGTLTVLFLGIFLTTIVFKPKSQDDSEQDETDESDSE